MDDTFNSENHSNIETESQVKDREFQRKINVDQKEDISSECENDHVRDPANVTLNDGINGQSMERFVNSDTGRSISAINQEVKINTSVLGSIDNDVTVPACKVVTDDMCGEGNSKTRPHMAAVGDNLISSDDSTSALENSDTLQDYTLKRSDPKDGGSFYVTNKDKQNVCKSHEKIMDSMDCDATNDHHSTQNESRGNMPQDNVNNEETCHVTHESVRNEETCHVTHESVQNEGTFSDTHESVGNEETFKMIPVHDNVQNEGNCSVKHENVQNEETFKMIHENVQNEGNCSVKHESVQNEETFKMIHENVQNEGNCSVKHENVQNEETCNMIHEHVQNEETSNMIHESVQNEETCNMTHESVQSGEYRHVIISDTDTSDSDSDSSSSDSDVVVAVEVKVEPEDTVPETVPSDHSDEEVADPKKKTKHTRLVPRTKGELLPEELPPLEELKITVNPNVELVHIGSISSIVGVLAIVQSNQNIPPLDDDTILFLEGRVVLGQIFEVFGPVGQPWYSVRFNTVDDICRKKITVGLKVFCAPRVEEFTKYVFIEHLKMMRGSDASWEDNNEPPSQYLDYSDDEQERKAKSKNRRKKKGGEEGDVLPGARVPKQRKHRERNGQNKNQNFGQTNEGGNHQKPHHWKGKHQGQNTNTNGQSAIYFNNQCQGDGYHNNQYQTFQPFGPSPQFRQRMPINRPPPRHQGPIQPSYFQPPNSPRMQRPRQNRGNFSNGGYQYRNQIQNQNNMHSFNRNDFSMNANYSAPWNNQCQFGEHDFPAPPQRMPHGAVPYYVPPQPPVPPFGRLMDNRLVQNSSHTEDPPSSAPP